MFKPIFDQFVVEAPIAVIARSIMEHLLNSEQLDEWFDQAAKEQYTRNLLFSSIFDIMNQVVLGSRPSVHAAYQASEEKVGVTITSVYNKIGILHLGLKVVYTFRKPEFGQSYSVGNN